MTCHAEFLKQQVDALVASADIASAPGTVVLEDTDDPEVLMSSWTSTNLPISFGISPLGTP